MALWTLSTPGDGVVVATYSNPAMNYFTLEAAQEFGQLIEGWAADKGTSVRAIVLSDDARRLMRDYIDQPERERRGWLGAP